MLADADGAKRERAMSALMGMKKFDVEALQRAFTGNA
jgi:predicted 3-demethylubiquinone-9 3-methyltransferase (glyoxalase superfamily)